MTTATDSLEVLRVLARHEVEHLVVGMTAAVLQGAPVVTFDLDVLYARHDLNMRRLLAVLDELEAVFRHAFYLEGPLSDAGPDTPIEDTGDGEDASPETAADTGPDAVTDGPSDAGDAGGTAETGGSVGPTPSSGCACSSASSREVPSQWQGGLLLGVVAVAMSRRHPRSRPRPAGRGCHGG